MTDLHSTPADRAAVLGWATPDHEGDAIFAIEKASRVACDDLALIPLITEAQAHATLALVEQQSRTADALEALVAINKTAARIAYTTRPGYAPGPAVREWIETELGL